MAYRPSRRRSEPDTSHPTRERLIGVTVDLIGEVGLERVDIARVTQRAEVTTGAIYHHFRDMAELLEEAMARRFPTGVRESLTMLSDSLTGTSTLDDFQTAIVAITEASQSPDNRPRRMERAHYLALAFANESLRDVIARQQSEMTGELSTALAELQARGWLRHDLDPKAMAVFLQAYTLGRIIDDITDDPVDPAEWNRLVMTVMTRALSTSPTADD